MNAKYIGLFGLKIGMPIINFGAWDIESILYTGRLCNKNLSVFKFELFGRSSSNFQTRTHSGVEEFELFEVRYLPK